MDKYSYISNAHVAYIDELYEDYKKDPEAIDSSWKAFFDGFDFAINKFGEEESRGAETSVKPPMNGN